MRRIQCIHLRYWTKITLLGSALFAGTMSGAAISVNGDCSFGTCNPVDTLAEGSSVSNPFSFVYTFADSDKYQAMGSIGAANLSNTTGYIEITAADITLKYLGNNSGTASGADTLVVDFLQNFKTPFSGRGNNGFEAISGTFGGPLANASSVQGQAFSNGTAAALMGPFFPPKQFSDSRSNQPFAEGTTTLLDFKDTIMFGSGSGVGSTISVSNTPNVTPEPSTLWIMVGGVAFLVFRVKYRRDRLRQFYSEGRDHRAI